MLFRLLAMVWALDGVQVLAADAAVEDAYDASRWRVWRLPLSMSLVAQDLMSTTGIPNSEGVI